MRPSGGVAVSHRDAPLGVDVFGRVSRTRHGCQGKIDSGGASAKHFLIDRAMHVNLDGHERSGKRMPIVFFVSPILHRRTSLEHDSRRVKPAMSRRSSRAQSPFPWQADRRGDRIEQGASLASLAVRPLTPSTGKFQYRCRQVDGSQVRMSHSTSASLQAGRGQTPFCVARVSRESDIRMVGRGYRCPVLVRPNAPIGGNLSGRNDVSSCAGSHNFLRFIARKCALILESVRQQWWRGEIKHCQCACRIRAVKRKNGFQDRVTSLR
jgi:hypothetical protein